MFDQSAVLIVLRDLIQKHVYDNAPQLFVGMLFGAPHHALKNPTSSRKRRALGSFRLNQSLWDD
jgi:hypothetical protein